MKQAQSLTLFFGAALLSACAAGLQSETTLPDPQSVRQMVLELESRDMESAISRNLQAWDYAVSSEAAETDTAPSHVLAARIGSVEHSETPAGLSFSVGNSDPRSTDFQKAYVLPVTCTLRPVKASSPAASLTLRFTADPVRPVSREVLIGHVSTACYNLLSDLRVPRRRKAGVDAIQKPAWMPEVRIETREIPASPQPSNPLATPKAPEAASATPPLLQPEHQTREGRRQIILHNQGSPVILEFGYDRR